MYVSKMKIVVPSYTRNYIFTSSDGYSPGIWLGFVLKNHIFLFLVFVHVGVCMLKTKHLKNGQMLTGNIGQDVRRETFSGILFLFVCK